jgi:glycosyltransferase involved in cell wall biosynthesis
VASDLPVFRELLTDKKNALLIDPQDSIALANALTELSKNAPLRAQLAENVRKMNFGEESWLSIAAKTIECYKFVQRLQLWYND